MKKYKFLLFFLIVSVSTFGQNKVFSPNNEVLFKIKNGGITVDGKFTNLSGTFLFDSKSIATSYFNVAIESKTIHTGNNTRDNHLKKKEYFDIENFPKIHFKTTKIELVGTSYIATGNLTIKGVSKEIKIPFTYADKGNEGIFNGTFLINRLNFKVGESSWILADDVTIILAIKVITP